MEDCQNWQEGGVKASDALSALGRFDLFSVGVNTNSPSTSVAARWFDVEVGGGI